MTRKIYFFYSLLLVLSMSCISSCQQGSPHSQQIDLDEHLLKDWAEQIILPSYKNYRDQVQTLHQAAQQFEQHSDSSHLQNVRSAWADAYLSLQKILIFNFQYSSRTYLLERANTYPTIPYPTKERSVAIESNIALVEAGRGQEINFRPTSVLADYTYQGFPALDYLLFAPGKNLAYYQSHPAARTYISMLTNALLQSSQSVVQYWENYQRTYTRDQDLSIQGAFSQTINAFVKAYEKQIRTYKVGLACGAIREQEGHAAPEVIEAYYNEELSAQLLTTALQSSKDFFEGKKFDQTGNVQSLRQILIDKGQQELVDNIEKQYDLIFKNIHELHTSLRQTAVNNPNRLRELFYLLQSNVLNFKSKMMEALKVQPDYLDTDGD